MALSEQEQKHPDQPETSLLADDPEFTDTLRGTPQFHTQCHHVAPAGVIFVAGLTALVLGVQFQSVIFTISFVMMPAPATTGINA